MRIRMFWVLAAILSLSACVSIPQETVTLSKMLGNDLEQLHKAHLNIIDINFNRIEVDINNFVDDVYAPFVIHYVLSKELNEYKEGRPSIYGVIETAGKIEGKNESNAALNEMSDFLDAARIQIEGKRSELISPIKAQRIEILANVNQAYANALNANLTITSYLQSVRKVKESQQEALSLIGLQGVDTLVTNSLVKASEQVDSAVKQGRKIDIQSNDASQKLDDVFNKIKLIITKNK